MYTKYIKSNQVHKKTIAIFNVEFCLEKLDFVNSSRSLRAIALDKVH